MQLILDTENPSVNIKERMSTLNPETEKPLPNGDIKEIVEEFNGKPESNGTSDKENVENKDNSLNKGDGFQNLDEAGDSTSADKPKEAYKQIQEYVPTDLCSSLTVEKENEQDKLKEKNVSNEDKPSDLVDRENALADERDNLKFDSKEGALMEESKSSNKEIQSNDTKETELDEIVENELDEIENLELDAIDNSDQNKTQNLELENTEAPKPDETEKREHNNTKKHKQYETEDLDLDEPENLELDEPENLELDEPENLELDESKEQELDETEILNLNQTGKQELGKTEKLKQDETKQLELDMVKDTDQEATETFNPDVDTELDKTEKLELKETETLKPSTNDNENMKKNLAEILSKQVELDLIDEIEHNEFKNIELNKTDEPIQNITEKEGVMCNEKTQLKERPEIDSNVKTVLGVAVDTSLPELIPAETKLFNKPIDIAQESGDSMEKSAKTKSVEEKVDEMEVDGDDSFTIEQELEDSSEKDVTQSISDMVDNIVQNLNQDTADDLMDGIEVDNGQLGHKLAAQDNILQKIHEESTVKNLSNIPEADDIGVTEIIQKAEIKVNETTAQTETISSLEDSKNKMEVDEEHDLTAVSEIPEHIKPANKTPKSPEQVPSSAIVNEDIIKDIKTTQKINEDVENTEKVSEESNKKCISEISKELKSSINIDSDIVQDTSVIKGDNALSLISDKIAQDVTDSSSSVKEIESKINGVDAVENNSEVFEHETSDSTVNNLEDTEPNISTVDDDIISCVSSDVEKAIDNTSKCVVFETSEKQSEIPNADLSETKDETLDVEEVKQVEISQNISEQTQNEKTPEKVTPLIKLSNTMNILSDEEDEPTVVKPPNKITEPSEKQCINLDDDDDIMLIDDDTNKEDKKVHQDTEHVIEKAEEPKNILQTKVVHPKDAVDKIEEHSEPEKESPKQETQVKEVLSAQADAEKPLDTVSEKPEKSRSLIPGDLFKSYRKNLADMTREDLEEFCILKIVESIIDRSNLNEIRSKLKSMGQTIEEYKKKAMMLTKQNRDLQVVLKSVQEEQKKSNGSQPITPLKITRSVGMQVLMTDKNRRRVMPGQAPPNVVTNANQPNVRNVRNTTQSPRNTPQKPVNNQPNIPVPRLVPAGPNVANKASAAPATPVNNVVKPPVIQNGVKTISPAQKPEKRTHTRMQSQSSSSVTVDLTDDEPPSKIPSKSSPAPPVRLVNQQNLIAPRQQFSQQVNSPRKVYIPISINGPQPQSVRPGQTIMLKTVTAPGPRPRGPAPSMVRAPQNVQVRRLGGNRHPAPLPDAMKQYQPPNWKALPPAPDLKLSKVENGIVISWKIEGYQEDSYEEIASYQLYAYQETSAPPSTTLWKKIGDVKALPLPMACTLTQFMAGYKYYFAVRAVDIRSRFGPFSLPGSILLLNKIPAFSKVRTVLDGGMSELLPIQLTT